MMLMLMLMKESIVDVDASKESGVDVDVEKGECC